MNDFGLTDDQRRKLKAKRLSKPMHYALGVNEHAKLKSLGLVLKVREHKGNRYPVLEIALKPNADGVLCSDAIPALSVALEPSEGPRDRLTVKLAD